MEITERNIVLAAQYVAYLGREAAIDLLVEKGADPGTAQLLAAAGFLHGKWAREAEETE